MTTWYVDYEGGTDSNASAGNGDSFATRRKTISNLVAAATAPGDNVRIMASTDPTSLGTCTWTDGPLKTTYAAVSSTNATPIVYRISSANYTAMAPAVGDTVIVNGHTTNTKANGVWKVSAVDGVDDITLVNADGTNSVGNGVGGASGTIRKISNCVVILPAAVTKSIACVGNQGVKGNWTASANVTCTVITSDFKEGGECQQIAVATGFTTGLAAHFATGTLDLSGYQQISFRIKQTSGTIGAAGAITLRLCTVPGGAVSVHTITVPTVGVLNTWCTFTWDNAANLNAAIESCALYVATDNGAQTFLIDCVIACKDKTSADSLTLNSLISKNSGTEAWWAIQSINDVRVVLEGIVNTIPAASPQRGYSGTSEAVTTYKRETTRTICAAAAGTAVQTANEAGTSGNLISYSGGWNRTDMSTQTGETWFDGCNGFGNAFSAPSIHFISYDKINFTRYNQGLVAAGADDCTIGSMSFCSLNSSAGSLQMGSRLTATTLSAVACAGILWSSTGMGGAVIGTIARADSSGAGGLNFNQTAGSIDVGTIVQANNNTTSGITVSISADIGTISACNGNGTFGVSFVGPGRIGSATCNNNTTYGIGATAAGGLVLGGSTTGNASGGLSAVATQLTVRDFTVNEATEAVAFTAYANGRIYSEKHDGTANNAQIFCDGGLISQQASVVHGSAATAFKFSPTSTNRTVNYPLNLPIAQIAVGASALVTVKAWMRRSNTGLTGRLVCKGGQIGGVAADVTASITAAADTWEEITITFTPSEAGVVEIEAQFYGGSTYSGYVSDATFSQA